MPRHADERDQVQRALRASPFEGIAEHGELALATDERRAGLRQVDAEPGARLHRLPDRHRRRLPLRLDLLRLPVLDRVTRRAVGRLADEDPVHGRRRLQPRRGVDDVAGGHPLALGRPGPKCDQRLARVDGDPHLELLLLDGPVADLERCPHRAHRVVLMRCRRAEERDHRVADELLDGPAEPLELGAEMRGRARAAPARLPDRVVPRAR
jgi:hypothetical protein